MAYQDISTYIAFGLSFLIAMYSLVFSGHLWKSHFFRRCLILSVVSAIAGAILEITNLLGNKQGLSLVVMTVPLLYIANFQLWRQVFLKRYGTEPYVTSSSSTVGSEPLDSFTSEGRDGVTRKFAKDRRIRVADFIFSFATHLIPALVVGWAVYAVQNQ